MGRHWKHHATRCQLERCERQRSRGWSTCPGHHPLGRALAGAGRLEPIGRAQLEDIGRAAAPRSAERIAATRALEDHYGLEPTGGLRHWTTIPTTITEDHHHGD